MPKRTTTVIGIFVAGGLAWEAVALLVANANIYDRRDVVNAIADAEMRSRHGDAARVHSAKLADVDQQLLAAAAQCGSKKNPNFDASSPLEMYVDMTSNYQRSYRETFRWGVAQYNNIFRLKALQTCRAAGACTGDWWSYLKQPDMAFWDHPPSPSLDDTDADRLQTAKDYACGAAMRSTASGV